MIHITIRCGTVEDENESTEIEEWIHEGSFDVPIEVTVVSEVKE